MRLVATDSKREADVAEIPGDEIVEGFDFVQIVVQPFGQFFGLGFHLGGGGAAVLLKAGVPAADPLPAFEGRQLNVGAVVVRTRSLFLLVFVLGFVVVFTLQVGTGPVIEATAFFFANRWRLVRLVLKLQRAVGGNVDIYRLIEHDAVLVELVFSPELSGGERGVDDRNQVVLEDFAGAQAWHGNVLLAIVGVDRSFALDGGAQILHGIIAGLDDAAVFFKHTHVGNFDALVGGVVSDLYLAPLLHARLALHPDAGREFLAA